MIEQLQRAGQSASGAGQRALSRSRPEAVRRNTDFAHESEQDFARLLNFYGIEWRYEPACFPLARDSMGNIAESFTPDFYLPEFDLFIELTTMKQRLVTKKNGKVRRFRELYPDMKLKILYRRDFRKLRLKFEAQE